MPRHASSCLIYLINQDSVIQALAATQHLHRRATEQYGRRITARRTPNSQKYRREVEGSNHCRALRMSPYLLAHLRTESSGAVLTIQEIVDTSGNCGGSYSVVVVSPDFRKKMTLARHKLGKSIFDTPSQPELWKDHCYSCYRRSEVARACRKHQLIDSQSNSGG
jgi:hypothetical protein